MMKWNYWKYVIENYENMQITKKLIVINSFLKDASVILQNMISSKGTFSKFSTTNSSYKFQNISKRFF